MQRTWLTTDDEAAPGPSSFSLAVLGGLQGGKHIYAGTVPAAEIRRRRAANRRAAASRRQNRGR